ncbi:MAG: translation elongation factor 4 [Patescibacteria group bacterium]|nr:MAG: translation elongation factor 4 [Patescibacteria group bacterium]
MSTDFLRNFALVAHIDHGKSTLADRLMEKAGLLPSHREVGDSPSTPRIDRMELETERGVTIKLKAVRMSYNRPANSKQRTANSESSSSYRRPLAVSGKPYVLNMIDTPGHADFSYEVSRSLAACEGVLLLVDATQGVQAQTLSHLEKARELGLVVVGVVNKIDAPLARVARAEEEMRDLGIDGEILKISALKGEGIDEVIEAVVRRIPPPRGSLRVPFRALVFDSSFDAHLGAIAYVRVVDGKIERPQAAGIKFLGVGKEAKVKEIGYFTPDREPAAGLSAGEVGFIATGLKDPRVVQVGDTVVLFPQVSGRRAAPLAGYQPPQSFVFASFFAQNVGFGEFRRALQTLRLEEPAISLEEISSAAFGRGFRIGFLGTFHLEIVRERLRREFDLDLVVTKPTVAFRSLKEEPWISLTLLTPAKYLAAVTKVVMGKRGILGETHTLGDRLKISAELPLLEFVRGFYDALKSVSRGYASFSWEFLGHRPADLVELEIAVHGEVVEGLSEIVLRGEAQRLGREKLRKLKEIMPRQQFAYALQAKVGGKIVAREDAPALRKDVTAPLYGGDVTRKRKLLEKQKKGKKRLAKFGRVEIPPGAFLV